jgi:hypothetical protein
MAKLPVRFLAMNLFLGLGAVLIGILWAYQVAIDSGGMAWLASGIGGIAALASLILFIKAVRRLPPDEVEEIAYLTQGRRFWDWFVAHGLAWCSAFFLFDAGILFLLRGSQLSIWLSAGLGAAGVYAFFGVLSADLKFMEKNVAFVSMAWNSFPPLFSHGLSPLGSLILFTRRVFYFRERVEWAWDSEFEKFQNIQKILERALYKTGKRSIWKARRISFTALAQKEILSRGPVLLSILMLAAWLAQFLPPAPAFDRLPSGLSQAHTPSANSPTQTSSQATQAAGQSTVTPSPAEATATQSAGQATATQAAGQATQSTGGAPQSTGKATQSTGGAPQSTGKATQSTGGAPQSTGKATQSTGGAPQSTGQATQSTGGAPQSTGQATQSTGGAPQSTGKATQSTGGAPQSTGKATQSTGGAPQSTGKATQSTGSAPQSTLQAAQSLTCQATQATGQTTQSTGNAPQSTGQATAATGNAPQSTGQATASTGNAPQSTGQATAATGNAPQSTGNASQSSGKATQSTGQATGNSPQSNGNTAQSTGSRTVQSTQSTDRLTGTQTPGTDPGRRSTLPDPLDMNFLPPEPGKMMTIEIPAGLSVGANGLSSTPTYQPGIVPAPYRPPATRAAQAAKTNPEVPLFQWIPNWIKLLYKR